MEFKYSKLPSFIIAFLGAVSNVLLLVAFIKDPLQCFRKPGTYLVINLSVPDLLMCLFVPYFLHEIIITGLDSFFEFFVLSFWSASLASIASISVDRFLLVAYPLKHRHLIKGKVMVLWLSGIWLGSFAIPILRLVYGRKNNQMFEVYCPSVIVIVLSAVMYAVTYSILKKHSKNIALQNSTESRAQEI